MDQTIISRPTRSRPAVVEALLDEIAAFGPAAAYERMLPAGCYTSPEFFEFEQKEVFARTWICVGRVEQVAEPGDWLATEVAGEPVLVARGEDGDDARAERRLPASRRDHSLPGEGRAPRSAARCISGPTISPGRLTGAPRMGDAEAAQAAARDGAAADVRLELWHGFIFVNLDPDAAAARAEPRQARAVLGGLRGDRPHRRAAGAERHAAAVELEGALREFHRRLPSGVRP